MSSWKLICPPKNWQGAIPIGDEEVATLEIVANRLGLVLTVDKVSKKLYLGTAGEKPAPMRLTYPSDWSTPQISAAEAGAEYAAIDTSKAAPLISAFPDAKLSPNFSLSEFRPGDGSYKFIRIAPELIAALEEIRSGAASPINVTSAYRPAAYNRQVGGEANSTHIDGLAADIYCDSITTEQLHTIAERVIGDRGGVGYYPKSGFIHVDVRGYRARWTGQ